MYPNFEEIKKYTGVVEARNMEVFRERLTRNGMLNQADDFFHATGAHTVLQYKEVNESLLRTANSGGFQLLGLADFPGQGSAFVGILDAFWESKGLVTPEKFRESCAPTVLLARLPKRIFATSELLQAKMGIYHYGAARLQGQRLQWQLVDATGKSLSEGQLKGKPIEVATVDSLGVVTVGLSDIRQAGKYTLKACLGTVKNEWDIWVYPDTDEPVFATVQVTRQWNEQVKHDLEAGKDVLLVPDAAPGRKAKFASHFWNPIMFNWNPMIVGTLIDAAHPVFSDFPTDSYADWQWWDILNHSRALELDGLKHLTPMVQSIDSYETNHKLGILFEARVGKGRLVVAAIDIDKDMDQRPATQQLFRSVCRYMQSDRFEPKATVSAYELDALFDGADSSSEAASSNAAIQQLLNK